MMCAHGLVQHTNAKTGRIPKSPGSTPRLSPPRKKGKNSVALPIRTRSVQALSFSTPASGYANPMMSRWQEYILSGEAAKTLFCRVPVWWEACTRRTPTQFWHPLDGYGLIFDHTSRKTIPQALDSNEAQGVSFRDSPNGPTALRPAPACGARIKIEQRALKKPAVLGGGHGYKDRYQLLSLSVRQRNEERRRRKKWCDENRRADQRSLGANMVCVGCRNIGFHQQPTTSENANANLPWQAMNPHRFPLAVVIHFRELQIQ